MQIIWIEVATPVTVPPFKCELELVKTLMDIIDTYMQ